jgi:hypothetical protein
MKYWVSNEYDGSTFALSLEKPKSDPGDWYGPFDTLAEAKTEARAYHRATIDHARMNITDINALKAKDIQIL